MSDNEVYIIDDSDEEDTPVQSRSALLSTESKSPTLVEIESDSDSDIQIEETIIKDDEVEYLCRRYRPPVRSKKRERSKNRGIDSSGDRTSEFLISSDSSQSQSGLKNELITPTKNPQNDRSFNSMNSELPNTSSAHQFNDNSNHSSLTSSQIMKELENTINSSVITTTVPSPEGVNRSEIIEDEMEDTEAEDTADDTLSSTLNESVEQRIESLNTETDTDITETETEPLNDFGVENIEDIQQMNISVTESELMRSPIRLDRSSTPLVTNSSRISETSETSVQTSPLKGIENSFNNLIHNSTESHITNGEINDSIIMNSYKSDNNSSKDLTLRPLNFEESSLEEHQPIAQLYMCSFTYEGCDEGFNNALLHYKHEKKHRNDLIRKKIGTYKCRFDGCPFLGLTQVDLIYHNSEHEGIFICHKSECFFRGQTADDISQHMKSHRRGKKRVNKKSSYCDCGELCCRIK